MVNCHLSLIHFKLLITMKDFFKNKKHDNNFDSEPKKTKVFFFFFYEIRHLSICNLQCFQYIHDVLPLCGQEKNIVVLQKSKIFFLFQKYEVYFVFGCFDCNSFLLAWRCTNYCQGHS